MSVVREVLFSVLLASTLLDTAAAQGTWTTGIATFTGVPEDTPADQFNAAAVKSVPDAACGYGTLTAAQYPGFLLASVSPKSAISQGPQTGCGTCLEVKCTAETCDNNTPVTVMVFDSCVECEANQINLYATAFIKFAPLDLGRVGIQYRQVPCPFTGGITVHILTYRPDKGGYIKLSLRNVKGPAGINSVAFRSTGTTNNWRPLTNTYGAVWEASKLTPAPLDLQITKTDGTSTMLSSCKYLGVNPTYSSGAITDIDMECAANFNT